MCCVLDIWVCTLTEWILYFIYLKRQKMEANGSNTHYRQHTYNAVYNSAV